LRNINPDKAGFSFASKKKQGFFGAGRKELESALGRKLQYQQARFLKRKKLAMELSGTLKN
jgi:hypothetical protein